jgi:hypothetical protein
MRERFAGPPAVIDDTDVELGIVVGSAAAPSERPMNTLSIASISN